MKLRQFATILGVIALVAVIYSPSTIGVGGSGGSGDGGTSPADTSQSGTSMFLSYLHDGGYHVLIANDSQQLSRDLGGQKKLAYFLIGPDAALSSNQSQTILRGYQSGRISLLIAEGNATNRALMQDLKANVNGSSVLNPASTFQDKRVFLVDLALGQGTTPGVIDIASPLSISPSSTLRPVAASPQYSFDAKNATLAPRTVVG